MKRYIALLLAALLLCALPALAEDAAGDWYANADGLPVHLALGAGGDFILSAPGQADISGTWELDDGFVRLNAAGQETETLSLNGAALVHSQGGLIFTREQSESYVPAEPLADATADLFAGYWKALFADVNGEPVPVSALEDETDLYIEGHSAILGGPTLGDVTVKLEEAAGALVTPAGAEGPKAETWLLQDGLLRLTVTSAAPQTWYLLRSDSPALED